METFFLVTHVVLCFVVVIVILLQSGQGSGLGAGFNNAAALGQEVFGGRGAAGFLVKVTVGAGAAFMITSMVLAWFSSKPQSALDLDQEADDPINAVTHEIVYEGGSQNQGGQPGGSNQQLNIGGQGGDGEVNLEELMGGEGEDSNLDIEFEDGEGAPSEELQQQLQEQLEIEQGSGDGESSGESGDGAATETESTESGASESGTSESGDDAPAQPASGDSAADGDSAGDSQTEESTGESQPEGDEE